MASNQNLVKKKFPYIDTFDQKEPVVISSMLNITVRVFEQLEIISPMDVKNRLA